MGHREGLRNVMKSFVKKSELGVKEIKLTRENSSGFV